MVGFRIGANKCHCGTEAQPFRTAKSWWRSAKAWWLSAGDRAENTFALQNNAIANHSAALGSIGEKT